jgi:hypothetical protein
MFDVFTTTVPRFGMLATVELTDAKDGRALVSGNRAAAQSRAIFTTRVHFERGNVCGFHHRALVVVDVPEVPPQLAKPSYRFALSAYIFTGPREAVGTTGRLYLRFHSAPFELQTKSISSSSSSSLSSSSASSTLQCLSSSVSSAAYIPDEEHVLRRSQSGCSSLDSEQPVKQSGLKRDRDCISVDVDVDVDVEVDVDEVEMDAQNAMYESAAKKARA